MLSADPAFLEWLASPSRATLRRLLQANQDRVYSLCFQVLRHSHDAEDAAQISLLEIARGVQNVKDPGTFSSWMYRVCLNNALTLRRESRRRKVREERRAPMAAAPAVDDLRDAVHDALAALDDDERALVVEHYFEKTTLDELGARRGVSGVAVWKRIEHAKERMKRALAGAGFAIGMTQMNSVLEAAEFVTAPSGFTIEATLSPRAPAWLKVLAGAAVLTGAILTGLAVLSRSTPGAAPPAPTATSSLPPHPLPGVAAPAAPSSEPAPEPNALAQDGPMRVLDPEGNPLKGALVFPGRWYRLRGDDAFDRFRPDSIKDGVKSDAEGRFQLDTKAPFISAWHDEYTPTTVKSSENVIRMKPRGVLKGRLVDASGNPREGVDVTLDKRGPQQTTDKEGRFQFDKAVAGIRGLILPDNRWIAVRLDPGETLNVDIGPGIDVTLDLSDHPLGPGTPINGGLMGVSRATSLMGLRGKTPALELKGVLPGRYWFGEVRGARGWVDITDREAKVSFGKSSLVVDSEEPLEFYLLPAEHNEIIEAALMKMGLMKAAPGSPCSLLHLLEGAYEIRNRDGLTLEKVTLGPGESQVRIKKK